MGRSKGRARLPHVLIVVENIPFSHDHRVRKQISSLLQAGYRVSVITRRHPNNAAYFGTPRLHLLEFPGLRDFSNIPAYLFEYTSGFTMAALLALKARLRRRIDVVQLCHPPDIHFMLGVWLRWLGARVVVDQRDLLSELVGARYARPRHAFSRAMRRLERASQRRADRVITVNDSLRERAIRDSGVPAERVVIVRNGPVLEAVGKARPDPSLKGGKRHLCCWVGKMGLQDRLDLLMRSVKHLVFDLGRTDAQFAVIGDGECFAEAKARARDLGVEEWVTFTDWLPEQEVFRYLATADLGIDAGMQAEVSPVKAMEYMAFGVPTVAFDLNETKAIADGAAAYAAAGSPMDLARTIDALLDDPQRRAEMGQAGRLRVRTELAWDHQAIGYLRAIEDALSPPSTGRAEITDDLDPDSRIEDCSGV